MTDPPARRRIRSIPVVDLPDLLTALVVALLVEAGLRVLPLDRVARLTGTPLDLSSPHPARAPWRPATPSDLRRVRNARRVLRRGPVPDTCLRQALLLGQRLRRHAPRLQVGVARVRGEVRAHAWLELEGRSLDPLRAAPGYQRLHAITREEP